MTEKAQYAGDLFNTRGLSVGIATPFGGETIAGGKLRATSPPTATGVTMC